MTLDPSCTPGLHCQQQGRVVVRQRVTSHLHCHSTNKLVTYLQHTTIQNTMPPIPSSNCYTMPFSMCLHISMFLYLSWFAYIDDKRSSSTESSSCKNNFYGIVLSFGGRVIKMASGRQTCSIYLQRFSFGTNGGRKSKGNWLTEVQMITTDKMVSVIITMVAHKTIKPQQSLNQPGSTDAQPVTMSQTSGRAITACQNNAIITGEHTEPIATACSANVTTSPVS